MRTIIYFMTIISIFGFTSCKHDKETTKKEVVIAPPPPPPPPPDLGENTGNEPVTYRLLVSFFSIGTGLDSETHDKFKEFLEKYPTKVAFEETPWGREGEVDYCFMLKEMKQDAQKDFIADLRKITEKSDRVRVEEYKPCSHKK